MNLAAYTLSTQAIPASSRAASADSPIKAMSVISRETTETGAEIVYYHYDIHGANFESSEILSVEKLRDPLKYAPGAKVSVRFDPKRHGNSMLV